MSQFDFPRINFNGLIEVNVGTGNNDDYSDHAFPDNSPQAGQLLRLADSVNVQPETFGMTDAEWLVWAQKSQDFVSIKTGAASSVIPAEWNFYGDMGLTMMDTTVTSVELSEGNIATTKAENSLITADVSYNNRPDETGRSTGLICDVNPEAVPSSQMIADSFMIAQNDESILSGTPSKASTRWINFQRNVSIGASGGASASFFHTIDLADLQGQPILDTFTQNGVDTENLAGAMVRYNLYRSMQKINAFDYSEQTLKDIEKIYAEKGLNPAYIQIQGTVTPWYKGELKSVTMSRQINPTGTFNVPDTGGNGTAFRLGPITARVSADKSYISLDIANTFPEDYQNTSDPKPLEATGNPKYDIGTVTLRVGTISGGTWTLYKEIGAIDYNSTNWQIKGGMIDISLSGWSDADLQQLENGYLDVYTSGKPATTGIPEIPAGSLMQETEFMMASDQSTVFAQQSASTTPTDAFNFNGEDIACSFTVYQLGKPVSSLDNPLTIQVFDTTPNQGAYGPVENLDDYQPGQALSLCTPKPGNKLFYATFSSGKITDFSNVDLMTFPIITMRVLPNEDYSQYYEDPSIAQPVANDTLTWDVLYEKVLRNYYLLYPAMSLRVPLDNEDYWKTPDMAGRMYSRIQPEAWPKAVYMPRTRDLSESRRQLLQAWCLKIMQG